MVCKIRVELSDCSLVELFCFRVVSSPKSSRSSILHSPVESMGVLDLILEDSVVFERLRWVF